jgi:TetR/AcrR family transcriptional regulator, transcriptional repressor for nem operon
MTVRDTPPTGGRVTNSKETRTDSAREQIVRAAAGQFASRAYHLVSLDDILTEAAVTKGAMYFHFRSKYALAVAIIEMSTGHLQETVREQVRLERSALETLIDISYLMAVQDVTDEISRAAAHLLEAIGRTDGLHMRRMDIWTTCFSDITRRAIEEGDILADRDPAELSALLTSLYVGIRQTSTLDDVGALLNTIENAWILLLPGFVDPNRVGYFTQFVRRRTRVAAKRASRC